MDEKEMSKSEVLNHLLSEIFRKQMDQRFPDIDISGDNRALYFKLWCAGVNSGLELDEAIKNMKELEGE